MKLGKKILILCVLLFIFVHEKVFGQQYFQQEVNNTISVILDDKNKTLEGDIEIQYINNSPDNLDFIYLHLYPNAYKDRNTKFAEQRFNLLHKYDLLSIRYKKGYIENLNFTVDNDTAVFYYEDADIAKLFLPKTLKSGDTIIIKTPFSVKIPERKDRLGYKDNYFAISQWFPKPAVYDKNGWHQMAYLSIGEFYSEFGNYDVTITVRDDYIVAATGNLQTKSEIQRLNNYIEICNEVINKADLPKFGNSELKKTIRFTEKNIHDFAFFVSPDFMVEKQQLKTDNISHLVDCWSFYDKKLIKNWKNSVRFVKQSVDYFSGQIGEYPYNNCSAVGIEFDESGGMEYPTITLVTANQRLLVEQTIAHEIAHNWFYGILASNERDNPWIDEGFTSFYENKYMDFYRPNLTFCESIIGRNWKIFGWDKLPARIKNEFFYNYLKHENLTQPTNLKTEEQSLMNYFTNNYNKTTMALYTLEEFLGAKEYKQLISSFYLENKFKHIEPQDIKDFFKSNSEKNIDWFFDDLIESDKTTDYKIVRVKNDSVIIRNNGNTETPLFLHIGNSVKIIDGFKGKQKFALNGEREIVIDKNIKTLDNNRANNFYSKGFFKKYKPIKVAIANFLNNPFISEIPILPVPAYNYCDGFMLGAAIYTPPLPKKTFEIQLVPFWAFKSNNIVGIANMSLFLQPKNSNIFREIELFSYFQTFTLQKNTPQYFKNSTGIKVKLKTEATGQYESEFQFRNVCATDNYYGTLKNYQILTYRYANNSFKNPYQYSATVENGPKYLKTYIEGENTIHYNFKDRGIHIRAFAGVFLYNKTDDARYSFRMSGSIATQDYLYDNLYFGRNVDIKSNPDNIFAHQFVRNDGGFTLFSPVGQSNKWLIGFNFDSNTFLKTIDVYFNVGMSQTDKIKIYFEGGIKLSFLKNTFNIYFPLFGSSEMWKVNNDQYTNNYLQKIRFTISLNKLNILKYREKPYMVY